MYVTIPVKQDTKKMLDDLKTAFGAKSYDETVKEMAKANSFRLLADLEGIIAGTPKFVRDHSERSFT